MTKPQTPEEQWDALVRFGDAEEARALAEMTPEQVDAALEAHGYDLDQVDLDSEAFAAALLGDEAPPADPPDEPRVVEAVDALPILDFAKERRERRPRWVVALVAAVAVLVLVAGTNVVMVLVEEPQAAPPDAPFIADPPPRVPVRSPEELAAEDLRRDAREACEGAAWSACVAKLDEAKRLDPKGEGEPAVQEERTRAAAGMKEEQGEKEEKASGGDKGSGG